MSMSMEQATGGAAAAGALTKTERGRLKKLRRRAALGDDSITSSSSGGSHRTGIVTHADYIELSDLLNRSSSAGGNLGPSVLVSNRPVYSEEDYTNVDRWQQSSGADHRDIIRSLLFHDGASSGSSDPNSARGGKKKGKRKRDSSAAKQALPSLPSWARIHNPAACTGLVVVEFYISDSSSQEALMPSKRMRPMLRTTVGGIFPDGNGSTPQKWPLTCSSTLCARQQPKTHVSAWLRAVAGHDLRRTVFLA